MRIQGCFLTMWTGETEGNFVFAIILLDRKVDIQV